MLATSSLRTRLRNPLYFIAFALSLLALIALATPARASTVSTGVSGTVVMPAKDKTFNLGGKLYNGTGSTIYYVRNYPDPTGLPSYDGVTYASGWYSVGGQSNLDSDGRLVRWSLSNGQWSPGAVNNDLAPYNGYPYFLDVDGVWVPAGYRMKIMTESFWPSCMCFQPSVRWELPGGDTGRWYKFWGPTTARGGRYYAVSLHS